MTSGATSARWALWASRTSTPSATAWRLSAPRPRRRGRSTTTLSEPAGGCGTSPRYATQGLIFWNVLAFLGLPAASLSPGASAVYLPATYTLASPVFVCSCWWYACGNGGFHSLPFSSAHPTVHEFFCRCLPFVGGQGQAAARSVSCAVFSFSSFRAVWPHGLPA